MKNDNPQSLRKYNSAGTLINTYNLVGAPNQVSGVGLAILGNDVYYYDLINSYMHGIINGSTVNFSPIGNPYNLATDFASTSGIALPSSSATDTAICTKQLPFHWNNNNYSGTGTYTVNLINQAGCDSLLTLNLTVNSSPEIHLGNDTTICKGQKLQLISEPFNSFIWQDGSTTSTFTVNQSGVYWVDVKTTAGCNGSDSIRVNTKDCHCTPNIPTAITPNGDGINDNWVISSLNCFKQVTVCIYNRYGSLVYTKKNYQNDWSGTYRLNDLPDATYYYVISAMSNNNETIIYKGNLTILR